MDQATGDLNSDTVEIFRNSLEQCQIALSFTIQTSNKHMASGKMVDPKDLAACLGALGSSVSMILMYVERNLQAQINDHPNLGKMKLQDFFASSLNRS